jgi:hypothetical protein
MTLMSAHSSDFAVLPGRCHFGMACGSAYVADGIVDVVYG